MGQGLKKDSRTYRCKVCLT